MSTVGNTVYKKLLVLAKSKVVARLPASDFPSENPRPQTRNFPYTNTLATSKEITQISMKLLLYIFISIILISCRTNNSENTQTLLDKEVINSIDTLFSDFNNLNSPGFAIGILKDSSVLYKSGYGAANLDHYIPID